MGRSLAFPAAVLDKSTDQNASKQLVRLLDVSQMAPLSRARLVWNQEMLQSCVLVSRQYKLLSSIWVFVSILNSLLCFCNF